MSEEQQKKERRNMILVIILLGILAIATVLVGVNAVVHSIDRPLRPAGEQPTATAHVASAPYATTTANR